MIGNGVDRQRGNVKWFDSTRGFGFCLPQVEGKDVFLHVNCLPEGVGSLREGQPLTYIVEKTRKGPRATNVQLEKMAT